MSSALLVVCSADGLHVAWVHGLQSVRSHAAQLGMLGVGKLSKQVVVSVSLAPENRTKAWPSQTEWQYAH